MNKEQLKHGNEIIHSLDAIDNLYRVMSAPYPQFSSCDIDVNSAKLDKVTLDGLKMVVADYLDERSDALKKEFEEL